MTQGAEHVATNRRIAPVFMMIAGVAPFAISACFVFRFDGLLASHPGGFSQPLAERLQFALLSLLVYGAVILSFLGGIRWGVELARNPAGPRGLPMTLAAAVALLGWLLVLWGAIVNTDALLFWCYAFLFMWTLGWDLGTGGFPSWFRRMRVIATIGAGGSFIAVALMLHFT